MPAGMPLVLVLVNDDDNERTWSGGKMLSISVLSFSKFTAMPMRTVFPRQLRASIQYSKPATLSGQFSSNTNGGRVARGLSTHTRANSSPRSFGWSPFVGVAGLGLGLSLLGSTSNRIHCDASSPPVKHNAHPAPLSDLPPPPQSSVSVHELTFGTVCGVCAGVFVKKGAKAAAFIFGGIFVLLQYFVSQSLVRVDWGRAAARFENLFYTTDTQGVRRAPNVASLWRWLIDFLTADFQPRASFIAGFALGLRLG